MAALSINLAIFAADFRMSMWMNIQLAEYFSVDIRLNKIRRLIRLSAAAWGSN